MYVSGYRVPGHRSDTLCICASMAMGEPVTYGPSLHPGIALQAVSARARKPCGVITYMGQVLVN